MRTLLIAAIAAAPTPALASSPDAWAAFRTEVGDRCVLAGKAQGMKAPRLVIHPVGTQGHGVAVLIEGGDKRICLMNKQTKVVELTPAT